MNQGHFWELQSMLVSIQIQRYIKKYLYALLKCPFKLSRILAIWMWITGQLTKTCFKKKKKNIREVCAEWSIYTTMPGLHKPLSVKHCTSWVFPIHEANTDSFLQVLLVIQPPAGAFYNYHVASAVPKNNHGSPLSSLPPHPSFLFNPATWLQLST